MGKKDNRITHLLFKENPLPPGYVIKETSILAEANRQLQDYFKGQRKSLIWTLIPSGTEFMKKVWNSLRKIPYGGNKKLQGYRHIYRP